MQGLRKMGSLAEVLAVIITVLSIATPAIGQHESLHGATQPGADAGAQNRSDEGTDTHQHQHGHKRAPMDMPHSEPEGSMSHTREASGTAWQPDATPMHAHYFMHNDWRLMLHYNVFAGYDHQSGPRGDDQFDSVNWFMAMAGRRHGEGDLMLRGMFSLEPWSTTRRGYPLLFQTGESFQGEPLVDRQHPHDFFMELSARYRHKLGEESSAFVYLAPAGEPALGPVAFPHRASAADNPAAPLSHHWLDSTHITFGVATLGYSWRDWQIEGSWFNGREPDEHRWDFDLDDLDSYSGRLTWNFSRNWSAQISHAFLDSPEELHPEDDVHRTTASLTHVWSDEHNSHLASTLAWGVNRAHGENSHAVMLEANWRTGNRWNVFGRAEYVEKSGEELTIEPAETEFDLKQLNLGVSRELVSGRSWELALGGSVSYTFAPSELDSLYGENPIGWWIFLRLRPAAMAGGH